MADMDELEVSKQKVLYLLKQGWTNMVLIQRHLDISEEDMECIVKWLFEEEYLKVHTIH